MSFGKIWFHPLIPESLGFPSAAAQVNGQHSPVKEQPAWAGRFRRCGERKLAGFQSSHLNVTGFGQGHFLVLGTAGIKHHALPSPFPILVAFGNGATNPFPYEPVWGAHSQKNHTVFQRLGVI